MDDRTVPESKEEGYWGMRNGNWMALAVEVKMVIGVYTENVEIINTGLESYDRLLPYYVYNRGNGNYPIGKSQESDRDLGHVQMGLGPMVHTCEIMWRQGLDLYDDLDHRLLHGLEFNSRHLQVGLGHGASKTVTIGADRATK